MHIDLLLVGGFLISVLIVGVSKGRNIERFEDYAVGRKNFGNWALVGSLVATIFGGTILRDSLKFGYRDGIFHIPSDILQMPLAFLVISSVLAIRMGTFLPHLSIAESIGSIYGKGARVVTAIGGGLYTIGKLALEFYILSQTVKTFFKVEDITTTIVIAMIVIIYSTLGGARAVVATDLIQFLFFGLLMPVLLLFIILKMDNIKNLGSLLIKDPRFKFQTMVENAKIGYIAKLFIFEHLFTRWMSPSMIQRFYMAKNINQVKHFFRDSIWVVFFLKLIIIIISLLLLMKNNALDSDNLIEYIILNFNFPGLSILLFISLVGLIMSTADSSLHISGVLITHDIIPLLFGKVVKNKITLARIVTFTIGVLALIIATNVAKVTNVFRIFLTFGMINYAIVCIPFMLAILGFRSHKYAFFGSAAAGIIKFLSFPHSYYCQVRSIVINIPLFMIINFTSLISFLSFHYLFPKVPKTGWMGIKDNASLLAVQQARKRKWSARREKLANFTLSLYLAKIFPKNLATFSKVGLYAEAATVVILIVMNDTGCIPIFAPIMALATFFMFYPALQREEKDKERILMHYGWPLGIFILLFMTGAIALSISGYAILTTIIFLLNICIGSMVLPLPLVAFMTLFAGLITQCIFPYQKVHVIIEKWGSWSYLISVIVGCAAFIKAIITNTKNKVLLEERMLYLHEISAYKKKEELTTSQYHHHFNRLTQDNFYKEAVIPKIISELDQITKDDMMSKSSQAGIKHLIDRLKGYKQFIEEKNYQEQHHLTLYDQEVTIKKVIDNTINHADKLGIRLQMVVYNNTQQEVIRCDPIKIERLFTNSLQFIQNSGMVIPEDIVSLYIIDTKIKYSLNKEASFVKTLPALAFVVTTSREKPKVAPIYKEVLNTIVPIVSKDANDLYKQDMIRIVDAHYGCFFSDTRGTEMIFFYILPIALNQIRDNVMNTLPPSPYFDIIETPASIQQELALEALLVQETTLQRTLVREVIRFIKQCHGDQKRKSGEPFYTHPMSVAKILLIETKDPDAIIAALLHDVVEDSKVPKSYIQSKYGSVVADIVGRVTHMGDSFRKNKLSKKEYEEQLRSCKDIRAIQVKLADRLHNIRTLCFRDTKDQIRIAKQTMKFYIPLAESVGVMQFTKEIKKRCEEILRKYDKVKYLA